MDKLVINIKYKGKKSQDLGSDMPYNDDKYITHISIYYYAHGLC